MYMYTYINQSTTTYGSYDVAVLGQPVSAEHRHGVPAALFGISLI